MDNLRIGFIGMGVMGAPMATHLARAGHTVSVYDINPAASQTVARDVPEILVAATPAEAARQAAVVVTMLPNGRVVQEVSLGEAGLIHGVETGAILLDTSSAEPWLTLETAEALTHKGVEMVDAPVSGAQWGAQSRELVFMVGGKNESVDRVRPLLQCMGRHIFHLGPLGSGHSMKCINNLITATTFMATTEGLTIGKQLGLDPDVMTDVLNVSTGMSWISQTHIRQRITNRSFDDPFKLELMVKDMGIAMALADKECMPVPLSSVAHHLWKAAARFAEPGGSISNMVRWVEHMTGTLLSSGSDGDAMK